MLILLLKTSLVVHGTHPGVRNCGDNNYYYGNLNYDPDSVIMRFNPVTSNTAKFEYQSPGHSLDLTYSKYLTIRIDNEGERCAYSSADAGWQSRYHERRSLQRYIPK